MLLVHLYVLGKPHLKFEMRSYQEMVESKIKHISDDSRKLNYYKSMIVEEQSKSQICLDSFCELSEKLSLTTEENLVGRQNKEVSYDTEIILMIFFGAYCV